MVSSASRYYDDEEPSLRRFNGRGHGYPLNQHDRDLPLGPSQGPYGVGHRLHHLAHGGRISEHSPERDANCNPRRRIPVACGRCRKRKIRCSGDPGNTQPCTNCKSAGVDSCQFLRVSSTEAHIKNETAEFNLESAPASSRLQCRMAPTGPQLYTPPPIPLGLDGYPYRSSMSAYQFPMKTVFAMPSIHDYVDENVDFALHGGQYSLMAQESVGISPQYNSNSVARAWAASQQLPKNPSTLFLEQDYGQSQYSPVSYPTRSMSNSDSKNMSLSSMASALPPAMTTSLTDRVLPYPSTGRQPQGAFLRSNDGHNLVQGSVRNADSVHSFNHGLMSTSMINAVKTLTHNPVSENASMSASYLPLSSSNSESSGSSQLQYISASQQSADLYATNTNGGLYRHQNDSSSSLSNGYSPSSRKPSQTSDNSSPATTLSNGQQYHPYISEFNPQPPMENMPVPIISHRSSDAGIQAS